MFNERDRFQDWLNACWDRAVALGSGFTDEAQCQTIQGPRALGNVSLAKGIDAMTQAREMEDATRWTALFMLDSLPDTLRTLVVQRLIDRDPASATLLYRWGKVGFKTEEEALLVQKIDNTSPDFRTKIDSGEVTVTREVAL